MKVLILLFVLVGVSCVTATPRDLSSINPSAESEDQSGSVSDSFFEVVSDEKKPLEVGTFDDCVRACYKDGYDEDTCRRACY